MTPKEELIQAIERSPDGIVQQLLEVLKALERQQSLEVAQPAQEKRMYRKQGVLVIDTGELSGFNINTFISEMREEQIQDQIGKMSL
jgi:hypothetical protein